MSKIRGQAPEDDEVWTERGELRNPADRTDQPGQAAPERTADTPGAEAPSNATRQPPPRHEAPG